MAEVPEKFKKPYDASATEGAIYARWEESGYFNPDNLPGERKEPFTVTLPPVNVTGVLHVGHAYEDSLQDAMVRFERMCGKKALFVPGTDSAAIATQGAQNTAAIQSALNSQYVYNQPTAANVTVVVQLPQGSCVVSQPLEMGIHGSLVGCPEMVLQLLKRFRINVSFAFVIFQPRHLRFHDFRSIERIRSAVYLSGDSSGTE